eukprot:gene1521-1682_t
MNEDLRNSDWLRILNYVEVNGAWGYMKDILSGVFNKHTPKIQKIVKGKVAPWLNEGVKRLMNERDKVLRKFRKTKLDVDQAAYKEKRDAVNVAMRKAKSSYHRKLLNENAGNPNRFWRTIKSTYPSKPKNSNISINFNIDEEQDGDINITSTYKYLGVHLDSSSNLNSDFDAKYKKASGRLQLLAKIRSHLDIESAKAIYRAMVLPVLTYCGILNLKLNRTQENKLNSFHNRAMQMVAKNQRSEIISPNNAVKKGACVLVYNILQNNVCHALNQYFMCQEHCKNTRNNHCSVYLPRIRTEYARKGFYYMGAKTFNELPLSARTPDNASDFMKIMNTIYT